MTLWLKGVANMFFDGTLRDADHSVRLALPMDVGFESDGRATTPMGPRDVEWLKKTAEDACNGRDFFAWWTPGLNADYFLGRAKASMWADVRWRKPSNDTERDVLRHVTNSLKAAYKLNPELEYPWAEWAEILNFLEEAGDGLDFVVRNAMGRRPVIGYRRRDVTVQLPGNWWITVPGSFSNFLEEGEALCAQDPPKAIWYSGYRFSDDPEKSFAHWRSETLKMKKDFFQEKDGYVAEAQINSKAENGYEYFALTSSNICKTGRCVCTVIFTRPEDREWATGVWKSLQPPTK